MTRSKAPSASRPARGQDEARAPRRRCRGRRTAPGGPPSAGRGIGEARARGRGGRPDRPGRGSPGPARRRGSRGAAPRRSTGTAVTPGGSPPAAGALRPRSSSSTPSISATVSWTTLRSGGVHRLERPLLTGVREPRPPPGGRTRRAPRGGAPGSRRRRRGAGRCARSARAARPRARPPRAPGGSSPAGPTSSPRPSPSIAHQHGVVVDPGA